MYCRIGTAGTAECVDCFAGEGTVESSHALTLNIKC